MANELLAMDVVISFEASFNGKSIENQAQVKEEITNLITMAKLSVHLKELEALATTEEKFTRTAEFFTQKLFSDALQLLNLNQLIQMFTFFPQTHLADLGFPPEAFIMLYQRFQQTGEHLAMIRQLPQPILQYIVKIDSIDKLRDGLQEVSEHLNEAENRYRLVCLLEFYIKNREHPSQNKYTSSGFGSLIAPVASLPVIGMFGGWMGYNDKGLKVEAGRKLQATIADKTWTEIVSRTEAPMKEGKSRQFFEKVVSLANHYEPRPDVSYQDSVLGARDPSRTPSPSRS